MTLILAGDIGGTKTILRLVDTAESEAGITLYEQRYPSSEFPDLLPLVQQFLEEAAKELDETPAPHKACFGVAGAVVDNTSTLPNLGWSLDGKRLEHELGIESVKLINDFAAVSYGAIGLGDSDLHALQAAAPQIGAPIGAIGAGTGLGQAFALWQGDNYQVFGSEGGHADFAPRSELEFQLLKYLLDKHNIGRVSVERVVSGRGIVSIYQFLRDRHFAPESPEVAQVVRKWEEEAGRSRKSVDAAAAISTAALSGRDRLSEQTMQMFVEAYGAEAGNVALKLLPYGGLYIAGGIAPKILPLLKDGRFMHAFSQKGRVSMLLEKIPVYVVLNPQVGLVGSALYAARM